MRNLARTVCALAALTITVPLPAHAQTATAFDGTYRGVSRHLEGATFGGSTRMCPLPDGVPAPLRIVNGVARAGSAENPLEGSVTAQGVLVMNGSRGARFEGQIDGQGRAVGRLMFVCSYQAVWQRQ
jgi:hypothetical protein